MDARYVVYWHGHIPLSLYCRENTGELRRLQHVAVLLSDPFQRIGEQRLCVVLAARSLKDTITALWMDSRGVPCCGPGNRNWFGRVFWRPVWDVCSAGC